MGPENRPQIERTLDIGLRRAGSALSDAPLRTRVVLRLHRAEAPHDFDGVSEWIAGQALIGQPAPRDQSTFVAIHQVVPPSSITPPRLSASSFFTGSCTENAPAASARR